MRVGNSPPKTARAVFLSRPKSPLRIGNGHETAKSRHIFRDFIDATAMVMITEKEIIVRFQKRTHNPFLVAADFDKIDIPIPWLRRKKLQFIFG